MAKKWAPGQNVSMRNSTERFTGHIAGLGTASGVRIVVGMWESSPLGAFTDVMVQSGKGVRTLLAPSSAVADYVSETYNFDIVRVVPLKVKLDEDTLELDAGPLHVRAGLGGPTRLGRLLGVLPKAVATHPRWLTAVNPVARILFPGVRTAGTTGNNRHEYYGVTSARRITSVAADWAGTPLGRLAPIQPRVRFGFSSVPKAPQLVTVTTTIVHGEPEPEPAHSPADIETFS